MPTVDLDQCVFEAIASPPSTRGIRMSMSTTPAGYRGGDLHCLVHLVMSAHAADRVLPGVQKRRS
jgi:hypothetical protein